MNNYMKRVFIALILTFISVATVVAQSEMFEWKMYSAFDNPKQIIEGKNYIYILADGYLYSYDENYNEVREITKDNLLSDTEVSMIKYNYERDILVVAYSNSNIDIITKDRTYNIPYLKEAVMTASKSINNINFVNERDEIYVSTDFGIVIINSKKFEIKTTFDLKLRILDATYLDNKYVMIDEERYLSSCLENNIPYEINNWESIYKFPTIPKTILAVSGALWIQTAGELWIYTSSAGVKNVAYGKYNLMEQNIEGDIYTYGANSTIETFSLDATSKDKIVLPSYIGYTPISLSSNNKQNKYWLLSNNAIASYKRVKDNDKDSFTLTDTIPMVNEMAVSIPYSLSILGETLYCLPAGICLDNESSSFSYSNISYLKGYRWHNIYGIDVPSPKDKPANVTNFKLPSKLAIHPDNDEIAYVGTWFDGLYKFEKGKYKENWNYMNSPIVGAANNYANQLSCLSFDNNRNLWMTSYSPEQAVLILKPDGNWVVYEHIEPMIDQKYMCNMIHPKQSATKWFISNDPTKSFVLALNINGTIENVKDDKYKKFSTFTDQDGKTIDATSYFCIEEDLDGRLWIGTDRGPIILTRPDNFAASNFVCQRVKIARNDGTNNADLLLDDAIVRAIKVDGANCKWIGTFGNGAYLLSPDGLETIYHFTTDNSLLPSNNIYDLAINQTSGEVFFATDKGLVSFRAEAAEAQEDYDNIYAFPNPVRPEHTGVITITGLMFNSLVKITDTVGNLIYQDYSQGGQIVWDGNATNGKRVKSGVYYVWASSSDGKEGVVTKIVFIN